MSMEVNGAYSSYTTTYSGVAEEKTGKETADTKSAGKTQSTSSVQQTSKEYLNNLRQKYPDVNITVVDFKSQKQKLSYMLGSSGGNNIAISQSIIDKMACDPVSAAKYEKVIADTPDFGKWAKETAESEPGCKHIASGICIDKDGKVTYWGVGSKTTEGPGTKEKMQKMLEEKRETKKKQVKADTIKEEERKKQEVLEEKMAERKADENVRLELLIGEGADTKDAISNIKKLNINDVLEKEFWGSANESYINLSV